MKHVMHFLAVVWWISGIVVAKGTASTLASIFIPPYAWYLLVEFLFKKSGCLV